ncbi:tetratricopeptide repeat protein [Streptomyces sp. NPDC127105]|uniref:tetratricopeptide repeat protein n=1 Tax=Streptomyces sp. NPDC127105 TaxID=3345359 RepID=UPI003658BC6F
MSCLRVTIVFLPEPPYRGIRIGKIDHDITQALGDRRGEAAALESLGRGLRQQKRYAEAADAHQRRVDLYTELRDRRGQAAALNDLGFDLYAQGQYAEAADAHQRAADRYGAYPRVHEVVYGKATAMDGLASLALSRGGVSEA